MPTPIADRSPIRAASTLTPLVSASAILSVR
jgi:hypothetical protein